MKRFYFVVGILLFVSASVDAQLDSSGLLKPYGIKSCKIVYQFFNGPQSGIKTIIFDDYGKEEKEEVVTTTDTAMMRKMYSTVHEQVARTFPHRDSVNEALMQSAIRQTPQVMHNLKIRLATEIYTIDLDRNIGYKRAAVILPQEYTGFEQVEVGKDTILGKPCKIVEIDHGFRIWYWGKIALKKGIVPKVEGLRVTEYAIVIDENYPIAPDEFKVPASVKM